MVHLILGLPGTGKSTYVRERGGIALDIGRRNINEKGEEKLRNFFTPIIMALNETEKDVYIDTYSNYFDIDDMKKLAKEGQISITVAIPHEEDMPTIFENIKKRGDSSDFIGLYKKNYSKWIPSWKKDWENKPGVEIIRSYYKI